MLKRILLVVGGTPYSGTATRLAVEIARRHAASITALPMLDKDCWKSGMGVIVTTGEATRLLESRPWDAVARRKRTVVRGIVEACSQGRVRHTISTLEGNPLDSLISLSRYHDLVIFGLKGLFEAGIIPEPERTITRLIRGGVRPILAAARHYRPVRRVLIFYSGSKESARTMKRFVRMGLWPDATIELACFGRNEAAAGVLLRDAAAYCAEYGIRPRTMAVKGAAARHLLPYAIENGFDLIVIGDNYRQVSLKGLSQGSISHIARQSDIPLFVSH